MRTRTLASLLLLTASTAAVAQMATPRPGQTTPNTTMLNNATLGNDVRPEPMDNGSTVPMNGTETPPPNAM